MSTRKIDFIKKWLYYIGRISKLFNSSLPIKKISRKERKSNLLNSYTVVDASINNKKEKHMKKGSGIGIGIIIGVTIGAIAENMGLWISLGVILGVLIESGELDEILEKIGFEGIKSE